MPEFKRSVRDLSPDEVEAAPKCPASGCGSSVLRPKCLLELNPDHCPRHAIRDQYLSSFPDRRPILVGEANPYSGADPDFALYPEPDYSAGGRLCRKVLGLEPRDYLRRFDRRNLCGEKWGMREARAAAAAIAAVSAGRVIVLLGSKVASAFEVEFEPFTVLNQGGASRFVVLPHPSGLSRLWNRPGAYNEARRVLREAGVL